jgi:outer membrane lipoprotein-sorting protein
MRLKGVSLAFVVAALSSSLAANAGDRSQKIIRRAREVASKARTIQAKLIYTYRITGDKQKYGYEADLRFMKPHFAYIRGSGTKISEFQIWNGLRVFSIDENTKSYSTVRLHGIRYPLYSGGYHELEQSFFLPHTIAAGGATRYLGMKKVHGNAYQVVQLTRKDEGVLDQREYFISISGLLSGVVQRVTWRRGTTTVEEWFRHVRINVPLKPGQFTYTPPANFKLIPQGER